MFLKNICTAYGISFYSEKALCSQLHCYSISNTSFADVFKSPRCCSQADMMPHALAASILWTLLCSCTQWEWSRSRDVCSTLLSLQRGDAAATSNLFHTIFHPSDPIIPSALPASSLPINLSTSFDSSPASLCSLSFINSSLVQRAGAVLGAAVVNNVREAGKKSSDSSPWLTSSVFSALQRQQFSVL